MSNESESPSAETDLSSRQPASRMRTLLPVLAVLLGLLLFQNLRPGAYDEFLGQTFDYQGVSYTGERISAEQLNGSVVVLNFWATYCPYCLEDIEHLKQLDDELRYHDFKIVGISSDSRASLDAFFEQRDPLPWPTFYGQDGRDLGRTYKVSTIPRVMLLDREGQIVAVARGIDDIKRQVMQLVHEG